MNEYGKPPWEFSQEGGITLTDPLGVKWVAPIVWDDNGEDVAYLSGDIAEPYTIGNANLIAAAPDLLAACEAAMADAKALQKVAFVDYPHLEAIIWNLEHAIDRARGVAA